MVTSKKKKSGDNRWNQQLEDWQKSRHLWQACQTDFCFRLLCSISFASTKNPKSQHNYSVNHRKKNSRKRPACPHSAQFHGVEDPEEPLVLPRIHLFGQRTPEAAETQENHNFWYLHFSYQVSGYFSTTRDYLLCARHMKACTPGDSNMNWMLFSMWKLLCLAQQFSFIS